MQRVMPNFQEVLRRIVCDRCQPLCESTTCAGRTGLGSMRTCAVRRGAGGGTGGSASADRLPQRFAVAPGVAVPRSIELGMYEFGFMTSLQ